MRLGRCPASLSSHLRLAKRLSQPSQLHMQEAAIACGSGALSSGKPAPHSSSYPRCCNDLSWCQVEGQGMGTRSSPLDVCLLREPNLGTQAVIPGKSIR